MKNILWGGAALTAILVAFPADAEGITTGTVELDGYSLPVNGQVSTVRAYGIDLSFGNVVGFGDPVEVDTAFTAYARSHVEATVEVGAAFVGAGASVTLTQFTTMAEPEQVKPDPRYKLAEPEYAPPKVASVTTVLPAVYAVGGYQLGDHFSLSARVGKTINASETVFHSVVGTETRGLDSERYAGVTAEASYGPATLSASYDVYGETEATTLLVSFSF